MIFYINGFCGNYYTCMYQHFKLYVTYMYIFIHSGLALKININVSCINLYFRLCTGMAWDKDGDTLAIIQDKNGEYIHVLCTNILI